MTSPVLSATCIVTPPVSGLPGLPGVVGDVGFFQFPVEHAPCAPVNPPPPDPRDPMTTMLCGSREHRATCYLMWTSQSWLWTALLPSGVLG